MAQWMPWILDGALLVTVFVMVYLGARKGFAAAVVDLVGYIASMVGGWILAKLLAGILFQRLLRQGLIRRVRQMISQGMTAEKLAGELEKIFSQLPRVVNNALSFELDKVFARLDGKGAIASDLAVGVVDSLIAPTVILVMQVILFVVLFAFFLFLVHVFSSLMRQLRHLPVIGAANSLLGGAVGLVEVVVLAFTATTLLHVLFMVTNDSIPWLCSSTVSSTHILKQLYWHNPLLR